MSAPVVGVSVYFEQAKWGAWDIKAAELPHWYLDLFQDAGGRIVLLPPATNADALDRLDGLVLVGGADVDARRYGAAPHVSQGMNLKPCSTGVHGSVGCPCWVSAAAYRSWRLPTAAR